MSAVVPLCPTCRSYHASPAGAPYCLPGSAPASARPQAHTHTSRAPLVDTLEGALASVELLSFLPPADDPPDAYRAAYPHLRLALLALAPHLAAEWPALNYDL